MTKEIDSIVEEKMPLTIKELLDRFEEKVSKEEEYRWHDLRENPDDLPEDKTRVICSEADTNEIYICQHLSKWANGEDVDIWIDDEGFSVKVNAWREIEVPKKRSAEND